MNPIRITQGAIQIAPFLFLPQKLKEERERRIPIYARITVDGLKGELASGIKVQFEDWDIETKSVFPESWLEKW